MIRMIHAVLLALSSVLVTPERPISPPELQAAAGNQQHPAVAADGRGWLAAWWSEGRIVAARIDESGNVVDREPIELGVTDFPYLAVATGSDGTLVAWTQDGIRARLVDRDGNASPVITIATRQVPLYEVAAGFANGRFLVVWSDNETTSIAQRAVLLDARGNAVTGRLDLMRGASGIGGLASGASDFLLTGNFLDTNSSLHPSPVQAYAVRIGAGGEVGAPIILSDPADYAISVRAAWTGEEYFVGWSTNRVDSGDARGARIASDNSVTHTQSFYAGISRLRALSWTGQELLASLADGTSLVTVGVTRGGEPEGDPKLVAQPWNLQVVDVTSAWNGQTMLIAYGATSPASGDVWGKLTDAGGTPLDPETQRPGIALALSPQLQSEPALSHSIGGSLAVWVEPLPEEGTIGLLANSVSDDTASPGRGRLAAESDTLHNPHAAFNGSKHVLVWNDNVGSHASALAADLSPLFTMTIPPQLGISDSVAWDGRNFAIAASDWVGANSFGSPIRQIIVTRIRDDSLLFPTVPVSESSVSSASSIASNGDGSLVTWVHDGRLEAALISKEGTAVAPITIAQGGFSATASWNGHAYVVATTMLDKSVRAFLVNANGVALTSSAPISAMATASPSTPRSAPLGELTLLAWIDGNDLRGALLRSNDASLVGEPFFIATSTAPASLDLVPEGNAIRIIYQVESPYAGVPNLTRVVTRRIELAPSPPRRRAVE